MDLPEYRVLLIDDDVPLQSTVAECLREGGINVLCAVTGLQGLELVFREKVDLVLLDLGLPEMVGFEVLRCIKLDETRRAIPVIVLTGWTSTADKLRAFELGAVDYVTKPFSVPELQVRIESALRTKRLQDQLTQMNGELDAARLVAETASRAKSEFLTNMSREIRAPMNGVMALISLLQQTPLSADQRALAETIRASSESLLVTLNDLLDFSKIEAVAVPAPAPAPAAPTLASRLPRTCLLAEDNAINQKVALRLLQQLGYEADVASTGREVVAQLERRPYDLVLMDVQMPEMDGIEATRRIRQWEQGQPGRGAAVIVALTANAMLGDREKCLAAGMNDYLAKPLRLSALQDAFEKWGRVIQQSRGAPAPAPAPATPPATDAGHELLVDMDRLTELSGGGDEDLRDLIELYLAQTAGQIEQLQAALQAGDGPEIRRVAHSCVGASATCGMQTLVAPLRELEHMGEHGQLADAQRPLNVVVREFELIRQFFAAKVSA